MSVEDVRRRYNEIDASLLAHGYQPWKEIRDEYNDVSTGMAPVSTFGGEDSTGGAGGSFEKTAWDNVKDVASGVFNSLSETISNRMALKNVSEMEPDELSSFGAYMEKPVTWDDVTDITSLRNPFTGEKVPYGLDVITGLPRRAEQSVDFLRESMPDSFKASKLYADYFYTADEKREQRQKVEDYLGIDSAVITNNPELWEKAMKTIQRIEKLKKTPGMLNEDGNLDMEKVYRAMPYLKEIQEKRGTNAAAMVLSEAAGMKTISDVYSNEFTRFYGSVKTGIERGFYTAQRQWTNFKAWKDARRPNAAEEAELRANDKKMDELPNYSYTGPLSTVGAMVGSAFENAPLLLSAGAGKLAGYGAGAAIGAITGSPAAAGVTAAWVGNVMSTALMSLEIGANQYETNLAKIDKNGRAMYTPEAAAMLSLAQGVSEGVLEQYTFKQMGRALFGGKEAKAIADLYKKDAALVLAESGMTKEAAAKALIEERLRGAVKSGALMMKAETQEEFLQQASDMIWENAAQIATHGTDADISSVEQILQESTAAALEAIPAIAGFGVIGLAGHPMANSRPILSARQHMANLMTSKLYRDAHENLYHANVIEGVANNLENIAELENKAPREVTMALDAQNRQFGMENTVMDVNTLAQMEGGAEVVQAVAEKAGISAEEVAACQQGTGMLEVKTSAVQQAAAKMDEGQKRNLFLNITKDRQSLTPKQLKEETETIKKAMAAFKDASTDEQEKAVEAFVKSNFKDEKIVKAARDILLTDPDHPMGEIRSRKRILRQQLDEILEPIKAGLRGGMKQGVDIVETQEGGTVRVSNNAPWYRKWYADHGRAPSEQELDIIARDIATGQPTPYSDYPTNDGTPEAQEYFAEIEKQLADLDEEMNTLNEIEKVLGDVRPGDVIATATLSPEARQVYSYLLSGLEQGNKEVKKSARAAALVAARMTDRLVTLRHEAGEKNYTAMDALPELLTNAPQMAQEKEAAQRFAQAVESQKEAVRRQYEGTEMWMKAPNGQPTNLTEDQWLAVRTPAFKAWFGDWEAEAEKQKYLNTTPIKVMENQIVEKGDISAKEAAFQWAEDNLPVQIVTRFGNVEINRTSIKDSLGHGFSQKKLDAITSLPEGMKIAAFIGEEPDFNGAPLDNGYFCYPILYQGETQVVFCRARRDINSNKVYVHEVWMEDEIKDIPLQTAAKFLNSKPHGGNVLYKSILANFLNNSNTASKVVDENGEPLVVYHGTTGGEFSVFDRSYGSIEGDMGNGFYFTDQLDDVTENYEGGGPDFENKVERLAEKIEAEENIDYEEAKERARKEMDKGAALYETFLKIAYPAYVDHALLFSDEAELYEEINREDYEDEGEYEEAIIQAQEDAWSDIVTNIVDKLNYEGYSVPEDSLRGIYWDAIMEGGISIAELKKQLANLDITDSNGDIANNEVLRITISELGYDGIVDSTVSDKFSNMNLNPETTHYIAFEPTQIKSVDNNGNFDPEDANIYHQEAARETAEERVNRISQEVFQTYLNDGIMKSVEETVAAEIGEYVNLDAMADPVEKDKVRDHLPYIRKMLADFNLMVVQKNKKYKDRLAAKIEYARRCFDNDERIQSRIVRQMDGNEGQGDVYSTGREAVPGRDDATGVGKTSRRSVSRVSAGVSSPVSGEKRGAREHFEKLYNETAKKHSENQGAFSNGLLEQSAWHGSPYLFTAFDLGAIGTGEGAQAHGWGLYFAKEREISEGYKARLETHFKKRFLYDGKPIAEAPKEIQEAVGIYAEDAGIKEAGAADVDHVARLHEVIEQYTQEVSDWGQAVADNEKVMAAYEKNPKVLLKELRALVPIEDGLPERTRKNREKLHSILRTRDDLYNRLYLNGALEKGGLSVRNERLGKLKLLSPDKIGMQDMQGNLYEVEIPEDNVLLNEDRPLDKQPEKVQEAIQKYYRSRLDNYVADAPVSKGTTGGQFYHDVVFQMRREGSTTPQKDASLLLNSFGIKGISYDGWRDGPCYVIFDDKAVSILNRYEQAIKQEIKGNYDQAQAIIRLFEGADPSTFMHEMSHHYLSELAKLANMFPGSEAAKDYETIMQWASWQDGQVKAYAGTASAKEFQARDEAIRKAEKAGDTLEVKRLKDVWGQERFARAFEEYLHSGDAPTSALKQIFRRFKRWLSDIYKTATGAGVRATSEVEAVMARMVATDAEIEAEALLRKAKRIEKVAPDLLDTDTEALMARWEEEAKEEAKEKMLKRLLRELSKKDVEKHLEEYRETVELLMQDTPCWQAERIAKEAGTEDVVLGLGYPSVEAYKADLEKNGGSYDDVLKKEMAAEKKRYEEEMPSREALMETAQEMLASDEYSLRLTALEEELLNRRKQEYDNPPEKLGKALDGVEEAIEKAIKDDPDALNKAVTVLKYAVNWTDQQAEEIANLQEQIKSLNAKNAEDREAAREKLEEEVRAFKEAILRNTEWLRGIRDAAKGNAKAYQGYAYNRLMAMTAAEATDARHWVREAQKEAATAAQNLTNAIRKDNGIKKDDNGGDNQKKAQMAKTRQLTYEAMAKIAFTLRRELSRIENRFAKVQKTLMNDKNGRIDLNHKYFINHLLYVYGLRKQDAIRPSGTNAKTFNALMAELRDLQDPKNEGGGNIGDFDMEIPEWLHAAVLATNPVKDYKHLTIEQLRDLRTFIDFLYTTGKNKNRLISMDMDVDDAVAELAKAYGSRVLPTKPGQGINKYMTELIKPETLLEVLGGKGGTFIKYLYDPLFKAMEQENLMKEKEAGVMNALISDCYNKKERASVPTEKIGVTLSNGTELTRENLIAMALNWGNSGNRSRLLAGLQMSESAVKDILEAHMREQDWRFVQAIWDHLEEYGDKVNDVIEKTTGNPMKRVAPEAFKIKVGDEVKEFKGGYYPISYDPERSDRASEFDVLKDAQAVGGAMAFGAGMGSTKARAAGPMKDAPLKLSLDVLNHHINQQIHIAAMRLACRDVYKLLGHREISAMITDTLGVNAWRGLRGWCENVWQQPRQEPLEIIHWTSRLRRNTVAAIMGYRVSTSALNAANIAPMMDELGAANAMSAMMAFARNPQKITDFVLADSVFMRNRATNMDQDLNVQQEQAFGKHSGLNYNIRKYASWILERTDMLTSVPTYYFRYHEVYNAALAAGKADGIAREEAHKAAHAAVRKVVGSADIVDQAAIQRSKNEMVKLLTPFYSFFNAMMNATWIKYYEGKYTGETTIEEVNGEKRFVPVKQVFIQRYAGFIRSYMFRFVLMSALETGIRRMISEAMGGGDDKKKREAWYRRFLKEWMANQMGSALGGFPYINLAADLASQMITGETYQTRGVGVLSTALTRIAKPIQDVNSMMKEKGKVDAITLGRDLTKGVAGTGYGVPDTVTDFGWNTVRFLRDDYRLNNPDNLREYLFKSMFDKPLKAKKK